MTENKRHFQMLRSYTLADLFTLGNAACGTASLFFCLEYLAGGNQKPMLWPAFWLLTIALVCDVLDGYVARKRQSHSLIGADLDSLADIVSFGVAPAVIGYTLGLRTGWDILCLIYFILCGISRLARFNVTAEDLAGESGKVKYFEGTPIPTSLVIVIILGIAFYLDHTGPKLWFGLVQLPLSNFHPISILYVLSGSAMISGTLRVPKP